MKALIIDDDEAIRLINRLHLESSFEEIAILEAENAHAGLKHIDKNPDIDLIVCDYEMPDGNGDIIYQNLKQREVLIPFVLFSSIALDKFNDYVVENNFFYLQKGASKGKFVDFIKSIVETSELEDVSLGYAQIRIPIFYRFNQTLCDIYLKLRGNHYVKILNSGVFYTRNEVQKYANKKAEYLYIREEDYASFVKGVGNFSFLKYNESYSKVSETDEDIIRQTHALIHDIVQRVGVTKITIDLASTTTEKIKKISKDHDKLLKLVIKARSQRNYLYDHSYMLSCIASAICVEMEWTSIQNVEKLCLAAIFHDLTFKNVQLAKIKILDSETLATLSREEVKEINDHIVILREEFIKQKGLPPDLDNIIFEHHETPEGTGFPRGANSTTLSPLSCVFIMAHEFVDQIFDQQMETSDLDAILDELRIRFTKGNFRKVFEALEKVILC